MSKKIFIRAASGFSATVLVTMIVQLILLQSGKTPVTERFASYFSSIPAAMIAQMLMVSAIGVAFSVASLVFENERWSFIIQGIVHFAVTAAVWVPVALICWTPMPPKAVLFSALGWTVTYGANWMIQYFVYRRRIRALNRAICLKNGAENGKCN